MELVNNLPLPFECEVAFKCDFCGKPSIIMSNSGILYCKYCYRSYGESIYAKIQKKVLC